MSASEIPVPPTGVTWAAIKPEFLLSSNVRVALPTIAPSIVEQNGPAQATSAITSASTAKDGVVPAHVAGHKRARGQNKGRDSTDLGYNSGLSSTSGHKTQFCRAIQKSGNCRFGDKCRDEHDLAVYLAHKPADLPPCPLIFMPEGPAPLRTETLTKDQIPHDTRDSSQLDAYLGVGCYVWKVRGQCPSGLSCRWGSKHTDEAGKQVLLPPLLSSPLTATSSHDTATLNGDTTDAKSAAIVSATETAGAVSAVELAVNVVPSDPLAFLPEQLRYQQETNFAPNDALFKLQKKRYTFLSVDGSGDKPVVVDGYDRWRGWVMRDARITERERRKIDFSDKIYIAPLTTVGNLPFRRIMVNFGADITIGEMAMAQNIAGGSIAEWALLRRHPSEKCFGVQIAGGNADVMTKAAELIERHLDVDFVDINMGCPLDAVCNRGMGAGLMGKPGRLRAVLTGMRSVLSCPLTIKMRSGLQDDAAARFAHEVVSKMRIWSAVDSRLCPLVDAATIHSRTRQQRYSRYADWEYARTVVNAACSSQVKGCLSQLQKEGWAEEMLQPGRPGILDVRKDEDAVIFSGDTLPNIPIIGNGDVLHWEEFYARSKQTGTVTQLIGRGALIKPWLPREIREQVTIDIRSNERLDMLKMFVNYGLEHWGSDQNGVNHTRRFLLEWLSFLHRYIPVGLLEVIPQRMNDRSPAFVGRDDLESLMASPNAQDWVKISELLLGPVPSDYAFVPKHKASNVPSSSADALAKNMSDALESHVEAKRARIDVDGDGDNWEAEG